MPHIRAAGPEQSANLSPLKREPLSIAGSLSRDVLHLRRAGLTHRAIAIKLGVSIRKVQTALKTAEPVPRTFRATERDADYAAVKAALAKGSTLKVEHSTYASHCPAPYSLSHFWRRFEDWRAASENDADAAPTKQPKEATRTASNLIPPPPASDPRVIYRPRRPMTFAGFYSVDEEAPSGSAPLEGGLLFISEPDTALQIRKGALCIRYRDGVERTFPRGRHRLRSIILHGPGANVTIEAMRFAIDEGIAIFVMHRAGEAIAVLTDAPTMDASANALRLRRAQFAVSPKQRLGVARAILAMKIEACELLEAETQEALRSVAQARDHAELLMIEALAAKAYWRRYVGFRPRLTDRCPIAWSVFRGRLEKRGSQLVPQWACNPCNAALNYGYAVALGNCTRALVGLGLDPAFGFLHHYDAPGRLSLSYDVIELVRPCVDHAVFRFLESRAFDRKEFVETPRSGTRAGGSQVMLGPKVAREVALCVVTEVSASECEEAARRVARCILGVAPAARTSSERRRA